MQAKHPIDELFHGALAQAEAAPPAGLFEGVMADRAKRKRGAAWWWKAGALLLIGCALGSAIVFQQSRNMLGQPVAQGLSSRVNTEAAQATTAEGLNTSDKPVLTQVQAGGASGSSGNEITATIAIPTDTNPQREGPEPNGKGTHVTVPKTANNIPNKPSVTPASAAEKTPTEMPAPWSASDEDPTTMDLRGAALPSLAAGAPIRAVQPQAFVLRHGEWWMGARAAALNETRTWSGSNTRLVEALNAAEASATYWSLGIVGGRTWRSGLSLGTGLLFERSERAFSTTYRTLVEEQEITSYYVTLNDEVFVSNVDTLITTSYSENNVSGIYRRALVRIPLELGWRFDLKRWGIMPKAGLLLELNVQRQGLSLDQANSDGPLMAVQLDPEAMRQRHPDLLMAMVGAELSFMVSERWRMSANPVIMWTAAPLGPQGAQPRSVPQRSGLEFGLTYTFPGLR